MVTMAFLRSMHEAQKYLFEPGEFNHFYSEYKSSPPGYFEYLNKIQANLKTIPELDGITNSKLTILSIILLEYIFYQSRFTHTEKEATSTFPYLASGTKALLNAMEKFDQSQFDIERIIIETKVKGKTLSDDYLHKSLELIKNDKKYKSQKHIVSGVDTLNLIFNHLKKIKNELTDLGEVESKFPVKVSKKTTHRLRSSRANVRKLFAKSIMQFFGNTNPLSKLGQNQKYQLGAILSQRFQIGHFILEDNS
jgi:hypothetical protein